MSKLFVFIFKHTLDILFIYNERLLKWKINPT